MKITYSRLKPPNTYEVWSGASHRVGVIQKTGVRWLAISPAHRNLGTFTSMSEAGEKLIEEEEKK